MILYDGDCRFCRAFAHVARRAAVPPGVVLLPFDDPRAVRILDVIPAERRHSSVHAADARGLISATEAFRLILTRLRGGRLLIAIGAHRLYPWVAGNRNLVGRLVPDLPRPTIR